jgi:hypothetical protein
VPTPAGSLKRLLIATWGVPPQTESALHEELQDAGFELLEARAVPPRPLILTEGFALARRP